MRETKLPSGQRGSLGTNTMRSQLSVARLNLALRAQHCTPGGMTVPSQQTVPVCTGGTKVETGGSTMGGGDRRSTTGVVQAGDGMRALAVAVEPAAGALSPSCGSEAVLASSQPAEAGTRADTVSAMLWPVLVVLSK